MLWPAFALTFQVNPRKNVTSAVTVQMGQDLMELRSVKKLPCLFRTSAHTNYRAKKVGPVLT